MPLEIVFKKPTLLSFYTFRTATLRKLSFFYCKNLKMWHYILTCTASSPRRQEDLQPHIQAHLLSVVKKVKSFLDYQGVLPFQNMLSLLECISNSVLHDWNTQCAKCLYFSSTLPSSTSFIHHVHSSPSHPIPRHLIHCVAILCKKQLKIIDIYSPHQKRTFSYSDTWNGIPPLANIFVWTP
jgi:hypothetical protein